jgi:hypothetical protein
MANKIFLIFSLLLSSLIISAQNKLDNDSDYLLAGISDSYKFYINTKTIKKDYEGYKVWIVQYLYNNKIKERNRCYRLYKDKRYLKFSYSLTYDVFDFDNQKFKFISTVNYDYDGNILYNYSEDLTPWDYIVPGSVYEGVSKTLQEYILKNMQ